MYVEDLYGLAPEHGATWLYALFPNVYIDANRHERDVDPAQVDGDWPEPLQPSDKAARGMGLIPRVCGKGDVALHDAPITAADLKHRLDTYYWPYHNRLRDILAGFVADHGVAFHVSCHSMSSVGGAATADPGRKRSDFDIGTRHGTTTGPDFAAAVVDCLKGFGYDVTVNEHFAGAESVRKHGNPAGGVHSLQIEINRAIYMDENTFRRGGKFARDPRPPRATGRKARRFRPDQIDLGEDDSDARRSKRRAPAAAGLDRRRPRQAGRLPERLPRPAVAQSARRYPGRDPVRRRLPSRRRDRLRGRRADGDHAQHPRRRRRGGPGPASRAERPYRRVPGRRGRDLDARPVVGRGRGRRGLGPRRVRHEMRHQRLDPCLHLSVAAERPVARQARADRGVRRGNRRQVGHALPARAPGSGLPRRLRAERRAERPRLDPLRREGHAPADLPRQHAGRARRLSASQRQRQPHRRRADRRSRRDQRDAGRRCRPRSRNTLPARRCAPAWTLSWARARPTWRHG